MRWRYVLLMAVLAALPAGCGKRAAPKNSQAKAGVPVQVQAAQPGTLVKSVSASGAIYALNDVLVAPKVPGKVARVAVKEGDTVRSGQLLLLLEDKEARAQRDQAVAGVASAEARVKQAHEGYTLQKEQTSTQLAQAAAAVDTASARLRQAKQGMELQASQVETGVTQAEAAAQAARARLGQAESGAVMTSEAVQAQTAQAAAAVAGAQANLDAMRTGAREQEKRQADLAVDQARANRDNAKADYDRAQSLLASGALSQQQLDAARTRYQLAEAQLGSAVQTRDLVYQGPRSEQVRAAEEQLKQAQALYEQALANTRQNELRRQDIETAKTGVAQAEAALQLAKASRLQNQMREADVRAAEAGVAQAQAAYELAKAGVGQNVIREKDIALARAGVEQARAGLVLAEQNLAATRVTAPVSGGIAEVQVDMGEMVSPAMPVMRLVTTNTVSFKGNLSEADVAEVQVGARADVRIPALGEETIPGRVIKVMPAGDPESHTFMVKIALSNGGGRVKPGMFAEAAVVLREVLNRPVIPLDAVAQKDGAMSVFVVSGGVARQVDIVAELVVKDKVAVASGLSPGDQVIVSGQHGLKGGEAVVLVGE